MSRNQSFCVHMYVRKNKNYDITYTIVYATPAVQMKCPKLILVTSSDFILYYQMTSYVKDHVTKIKNEELNKSKYFFFVY